MLAVGLPKQISTEGQVTMTTTFQPIWLMGEGLAVTVLSEVFTPPSKSHLIHFQFADTRRK